MKRISDILTKKFLFQKYTIEQLSGHEIAKMVDCDWSIVYKRMKKFKISIHPLKRYFCSDCGNIVSDKCHKRCAKCNTLFYSNENHPSWKGGKNHCDNCGKSLSNRIARKCRSCSKKKNLNPNYIDGNGNYPYPSIFNDELKLKIRKRDNRICQCCGAKDVKQIKKCLTIHHIDYNKQNCKEDNLISLCNKCNLRANGDRDYWYAYYTYLMENK